MNKSEVAFFLVLLTGCNKPSPVSIAQADEKLPPAYPRTEIADPATNKAIGALETLVKDLKSPGGQSLYSEVEILPPTRTVLPYGVGRYEQQFRLPVILTTGPGWAKLNSSGREGLVRKTQAECLSALERAGCKIPLTLTIQEPDGWQVSWLNESAAGHSIFVGGADE